MNASSLILGIESSCDETAASVVRDGVTVLSNVIASQHDLHAKFGGVVPEIASRAHIERILPVINEALDKAGVTLNDLTAVAVGNRPGLIGSLLVGVSAAKALAWSLGKPLVAVDHVEAHLYAAALDSDPIAYPALGLVVSGGHTSLYLLRDAMHIEVLGRTIDDAVGEAYDKVAAILDLGFPGGPIVDKLARTGDANAIDFPRSLLDRESLDFSFSGMKTAVLYKVRGHPVGRGRAATFERSAADLTDTQKADIAASFQRAAVDVLIRKLERAITQHPDIRSIVIGGGVSANSRLRAESLAFGEKNKLPVRLPRMAFCIDNAAMIAGLGHEHHRAGRFADLNLEAAATASI
ncbi:MAG: tRNA (adenosine(37)-N6)-threonylcarbamoyltransferase complex transferase subunit TsaD [Planctomycetes bacterium]|nr:tRNA (adenosine(37)-N6)-threonylcarbamoyltransferase complex transferase subunit TsaD [Planctomycetota bacterium]